VDCYVLHGTKKKKLSRFLGFEARSYSSLSCTVPFVLDLWQQPFQQEAENLADWSVESFN
jgi:hypothetical protein